VTDRISVSDEVRSRWSELALSIRTTEVVISKISNPDVGTPFALVDDAYPRESISQWCREGLRSAVDHLRIWADHAVPLHQYEGQIVTGYGFRWYFTLMRAAQEGAAQSLWLSRPLSVPEATAHLIRMVRHDLGEQIKAWDAMGRDASTIRERLVRHVNAAAALEAHGKNAATLPSMVDLIKAGAYSVDLDGQLYESHWRTCSAAAHGKDWAIHELQTMHGEPKEWRPGQFHFVGTVNAERLTEVLSDSVQLLNAAMIRYLQRSYSGDIDALNRRAVYEAAKQTPQKDDGSRLRALAEQLGLEP
jgi:hypothetical protein